MAGSRKGRKLRPYRTRNTPCDVTFVSPDELAEMADAMVPATPYEHFMTRALLEMPIEWVTM